MSTVCVNIACGDSYIEGWRNFDYAPHSGLVVRANLLGRLPVENCEADVVYSSHFLEHVPRNRVSAFISECFRIVKPGGKIRLVVPDLEEMCRVYLRLREECEHTKADFVILEMLDQCVRTVPGGELGAFYGQIEPSNEAGIVEFVRQRTGHVISSLGPRVGGRVSRFLRRPALLIGKLERLYLRAVLTLLPSAFREQNVSLASIGERHTWIYDFYTLQKVLQSAGFVDVKRVTASNSSIPYFPVCPLDIDAQGRPRKGAESMYVEAKKP